MEDGTRSSGTRNIAMVIRYDGSRSQGWQRRKHGLNTIQAGAEAVRARAAGFTAPARGLCLEEVRYEPPSPFDTARAARR